MLLAIVGTAVFIRLNWIIKCTLNLLALIVYLVIILDVRHCLFDNYDKSVYGICRRYVFTCIVYNVGYYAHTCIYMHMYTVCVRLILFCFPPVVVFTALSSAYMCVSHLPCPAVMSIRS